ncbi:MAG: hypothetical protein ACTHOU_00400 [Aureliella sp.]
MKTTTQVMAMCVATLVFALPARTFAAPLDQSHFPADAKWVIHVDLKALGETKLAERVRENRGRMLIPIRMWLQNRYGIDLREGLDSVTLYSKDYETHAGTMILRADFDQNKVQSNLESRSDVTKQTHGPITFYEIDPHQRAAQGSAAETKADPDDRPARQRVRQHAHHYDRPMTIVLLDGKTAIFASSDERAQDAVALVQGQANAPKTKDSPLLSHLTEGTIFYGAARDLGRIEQHEGFFPILSQHDQIFVAAGVKNDQVFKDLTLIAQDDEVAKHMEKALEGLDALGIVWAKDSEALKSVIEHRKITRDGKTVEMKGQVDRETAAKAVDELWNRLLMRLDLNDAEKNGAE